MDAEDSVGVVIKSTEAAGAESQTVGLPVNQGDTDRESTELRSALLQLPRYEVTEHDYTLPVTRKEGECRPHTSLRDTAETPQLEQDAGERGCASIKAVRSLQSSGLVRRDSGDSGDSGDSIIGSISSSSGDSIIGSISSSSSSSSSVTKSGTSTSSSSSSSSSSNANNSTGNSDSGGGGSSSSNANNNNNNNNGGGGGGGGGGDSSSSSSWFSVYSSSIEPLTDDSVRSNKQTKTSVPPEQVSISGELPQGLHLGTPIILSEKATVIIRKKNESNRQTRLSGGGSSSDERTAIVEVVDSKTSPSYPTDIVQAYDKAVAPSEEDRRDNNTSVVINKCQEAVGSRITYVRTLAESALGDYFTPHDVSGKSDADTSTSDLDISDSSNYEQRYGAVESCVLDAYVDLAQEEDNETKMLLERKIAKSPIPTPSEGRVSGCSIDEIREIIKIDAEVLSEGTTSSEECRECANLESECRTPECECASGNEEEVEGTTESDDQRYYEKEVLQACKTACKSLKRAIRNHEMTSKISATAEQCVTKIKVSYSHILSCMSCMTKVVSPAVEANRLAQIAQTKASSLSPERRETVVKSAIIASRFTRLALCDAEDAVRFHEEAFSAVSDAETSLDEIQVDESISDDIVREVTAAKDDLDKLAEDIANISLKELHVKRDTLQHKAGTGSFALRAAKNESACMGHLSETCEVARTQVLAALVSATHNSANAMDAAAKALEALSSVKET